MFLQTGFAQRKTMSGINAISPPAGQCRYGIISMLGGTMLSSARQ
jgi:hypothetical protein